MNMNDDIHIKLRPYQVEALEAVLEAKDQGISRQLVVLPTGSGKTIVMAAIGKLFNKRLLLLAHREELIQQAFEKFKLFWPDADIGICMTGREETNNQIVIGSVQSCSRPRKLARLKERGFDVLMIDEAHHSTTDSYQSIINTCGFSRGTDKLLIGVTATPARGDKQPLGDTFDKITFSRSIGTMIRAGYISPVIGRKILTSFVLERVRSQNGDFAINELAEIVDTPERNNFIVTKFKEYAIGRKGVAFCCNVEHCKHLADEFRSQGIAASAVWGDMEPADRKQALADLKNDRIQVAISCGILTEGFDEPSIDVIVMARPTKSPGLYIQCVGRGLRLWPGKENCLVLDFSDRGHSLDSVMSLNSAIPEIDIIREEREEEQEEKEEIDKTTKIECLDEIDREFDILGTRRFIWVPIGNDEWSLLDDQKSEIVMNPEGSGYTATLYYPDGSRQRITNTPLPIEYCSGVCEDYARRNLKIAFCDLSEATWMRREEVPTQAQRTYLESQNAWNDNFTKAQASLEIRKIISMKNKQRRSMASEPITDKQRYFLNGYSIETEGMSKLAAMMKISELKQLVKR